MSKTLNLILSHWNDTEDFKGEFGNLDLPFNIEGFCLEMDSKINEVMQLSDLSDMHKSTLTREAYLMQRIELISKAIGE